jgi:hypothetical protein
MNTSRPPGPTITGTDSRENGMSLSQHPAGTGLGTDPPRRSRVGRLAIIAGVVVTLLALAGIGFLLLGDDNGGQPAQPAPTPAAQVTTEPTAEPAPQTAADIAAAEAQERYLEYLRVVRQVAAGGYTDLSAYDAVAIDPHTGVLLQSAAQNAGLRSTGDAEVVSLTVQSVELDPPGQYPSVRLLACLDVSQVDVIDASGKSVITADRVEQFRSEVVVQNIPPGAFADGREPGWYVADVEQRGEPC